MAKISLTGPGGKTRAVSRPTRRTSKVRKPAEKTTISVAIETALSPTVVNDDPKLVQDTLKNEVKDLELKETLSNKKLADAHIDAVMYSKKPMDIIQQSMVAQPILLPTKEIIQELPPTNTGTKSLVSDTSNLDSSKTVDRIHRVSNINLSTGRFNPLNDQIIGFASIDSTEIFIPSTTKGSLVSEPDNARDNSLSSADFYETNYSSLEIIINDIMETYKEEIEDENSRYYKLFETLSRVNSIEAFQIFFIFFTNLNRGTFSIEDYFVFLDNNDKDVNYETIVNYIGRVNSNKIEIMKNRLEKGLYEVYGNLYDYINKRRLNNTDAIIHRTVSLDSDLFKSNENFIFKPYIDYFSPKAYRNKVQAERDYWSIVSDYAGIISITDNLQLDRLLKILTLKDYNNTNGLPVFLKKDLTKNLFFNSNELDILMSVLLKDTYAEFSYLEIKNYVNLMIAEIVDYYETEIEDLEEQFDYSKNSLMMPDIKSFLVYKAGLLHEKFPTIENIAYSDFKEINFYYSIMFDFINDTDTSSGDLNEIKILYTNMLLLYSTSRNEILGLWNHIKLNGKYL